MQKSNELKKARTLYDTIVDRGLYVSTNFDVFSETPENVALAFGAGYKIPLVVKGSKAYASPLLFATLTSLMNHGTMLLTGAPGIGKTTSAEYAGHFFMDIPLDEILQAEILGNPQLKTEDIVASLDTVKMISRGEKEVLPAKFLQCPVKVWDEVNRTPPDLLSAGMKLVDIGKAVYQGVLLQSPPGCLFATANYSDEGTFQLTPPFLDRFDVAVMVASPQPWDLRNIRQRGDSKLNGNLDELLNIPEKLKLDHEKIRKEIKELPEEEEKEVQLVSSFADFLYASLRFSEAGSNNLARATKGNAWQVNQDNAHGGHHANAPFNYTLNELSIRTAVGAMNRYAKAFAWFNGKSKVELADLKTVLPYLLWHKVQPSKKAITEKPEFINDRIAFIEQLVEQVEADYIEMRESEALKVYSLALNVIKTGTLQGKPVSEDTIRKFVTNAITKIGTTDKVYAITLASHIASEYNKKINSEEGKND